MVLTTHETSEASVRAALARMADFQGETWAAAWNALGAQWEEKALAAEKRGGKRGGKHGKKEGGVCQAAYGQGFSSGTGRRPGLSPDRPQQYKWRVVWR